MGLQLSCGPGSSPWSAQSQKPWEFFVLAFPALAGDNATMASASPKFTSSGTSTKPGFFTMNARKPAP